MSDNSKICEYYSAGMCVYANERFAIFEQCFFENIQKEFQINHMQNCIQKKVIERLKIRELQKE